MVHQGVWGNEVRRLSFASSASSRVREFARLVTCFPDPKYNKIAKILPGRLPSPAQALARLADADALWQLDG
jgi:hypothetical protein